MAHYHHTFRLGPRIPQFNIDEASPVLVLRDGDQMGAAGFLPSRVMPRADSSETCLAGNANLCEKPASSSSNTLVIVLSIALPVVGAIGVLLYLHRRSSLRLKKEDSDDLHKSLDFGIDEGKSKKKGPMFGASKEKDPRHRAQLSMDMNLSSPYLLPPQLQGSRESLHSLARSLKEEGNPYGPADDAASINSGRPGMQRKNTDGLSTSSGHVSTRTGPYIHPPPRQNSDPASISSVTVSSPLATTPPRTVKNPFDTPTPSMHSLRDSDILAAMPSPPTAAAMPYSPMHPPERSAARQLRPENSPYHDDNLDVMSPRTDTGLLQSPAPVAVAGTHPATSGPHDGFDFGLDSGPNNKPESDYAYNPPSAPGSPPVPQRQSPKDLGLLDPPQRQASLPKQDNQFQAYSATITHEHNHDEEAHNVQDEYFGRGRHLSRRSNMMGQNDSLGVSAYGQNRVSVGARPLPPSDVIETEDPERRAERIRSFYKEYFEDSKRESAVPPLPTIPSHQASKGTDYYEDYDQGYLGDAAVFDPDSNAFVMPYAEPVTRRAMTPPPRGRVPGRPFRGPRPHAGSVGGMSLTGGGRPPPRPRAGSSTSAGPGRFRGPPGMPGSAPGSRAGSRGPRARTPLPPPAALNTLPTPSKLRDDSFAILGSIDFAPPDTFAERARGRSQSPAGERRPYQPKAAAISPLAGSYDEMAALPSPHHLRKSGTFTGLEFAPPKKFGQNESDQMSDAGSILSNKTGISAANNHAIRSGAGRVSKLPEDMVFTSADLNNQLKPQWTLRP